MLLDQIPLAAGASAPAGPTLGADLGGHPMGAEINVEHVMKELGLSNLGLENFDFRPSFGDGAASLQFPVPQLYAVGCISVSVNVVVW